MPSIQIAAVPHHRADLTQYLRNHYDPLSDITAIELIESILGVHAGFVTDDSARAPDRMGAGRSLCRLFRNRWGDKDGALIGVRFRSG
jgi:hypothetical protein